MSLHADFLDPDFWTRRLSQGVGAESAAGLQRRAVPDVTVEERHAITYEPSPPPPTTSTHHPSNTADGNDDFVSAMAWRMASLPAEMATMNAIDNDVYLGARGR